MLDKFDYLEPSCKTCGGKDFYYPKKDAPISSIPVMRIIEKIDRLSDQRNYAEVGRLLEFWKDEAAALNDKMGELAMASELVGFYRKQGDKEKGLISIDRALKLIDELGQGDLTSGATILINCATAYKAFEMPKEALPLYKKAKEVYEKNLPKFDAKFGGLYNNMALSLSALGDFEGAEIAYLKALEVMKNTEGGEPECAITYINLAHAYEKYGKTDKISDCLDNAYKMLTSDKVKENGYLAFVLEKCAPSFGYFGRVDVYEKLKKRSEEIYERD